TATRLFTPRLVVSNELPTRNHIALRFRHEILPHLDGAYNLARYLTRDPVLSEDIVQDAFVRAFQAFGQFRGDSPRAWLFAIVRNCCRTAMSGRGGVLGLAIAESSRSDEQNATGAAEKADPAHSTE